MPASKRSIRKIWFSPPIHWIQLALRLGLELSQQAHLALVRWLDVAHGQLDFLSTLQPGRRPWLLKETPFSAALTALQRPVLVLGHFIKPKRLDSATPVRASD